MYGLRAVIFVRAILHTHVLRTKRHSAEPDMAKHEQMRMRKLKGSRAAGHAERIGPGMPPFEPSKSNALCSTFTTFKIFPYYDHPKPKSFQAPKFSEISKKNET